MDLLDLVRAENVDVAAVAELLDNASHTERVKQVRSLPRRAIPRLYDAAVGAAALTVEDFVPASTPSGDVVQHHGINSLPLFRTFGKPMYRTDDGVVGGRNAQFWAWLTGPGYFTVNDQPGGEAAIFIDYVRMPSRSPDGWPRLRGNSGGFSFFVYRGLADYMRRLSHHVTVGHAFRNGKDIGQYFILVREPSTG